MPKKLNKNDALIGSRLAYNVAAQRQYIDMLNKLFKQMMEETQKKVIKLFEQPTAEKFFAEDASITSQATKLANKLKAKFQTLFDKAAPKVSTKMVDTATKISSNNLNTSFKKLSGAVTLKTNFLTPDLREITKASVDENVALIKSIANEYLSAVNKTVLRSITTGNGLKTLVPALQKYEKITYRKAKNVALDQTRKAYNSVNAGRMQKVGVKQFVWVHSGGDQRPRKSHLALNGKVISFDDLPIINQEQVEKGYEAPERGIPGQAINCTCTMTPVINFD